MGGMKVKANLNNAGLEAERFRRWNHSEDDRGEKHFRLFGFPQKNQQCPDKLEKDQGKGGGGQNQMDARLNDYRTAAKFLKGDVGGTRRLNWWKDNREEGREHSKAAL